MSTTSSTVNRRRLNTLVGHKTDQCLPVKMGLTQNEALPIPNIARTLIKRNCLTRQFVHTDPCELSVVSNELVIARTLLNTPDEVLTREVGRLSSAVLLKLVGNDSFWTLSRRTNVSRRRRVLCARARRIASAINGFVILWYPLVFVSNGSRVFPKKIGASLGVSQTVLF